MPEYPTPPSAIVLHQLPSGSLILEPGYDSRPLTYALRPTERPVEAEAEETDPSPSPEW